MLLVYRQRATSKWALFFKQYYIMFVSQWILVIPVTPKLNASMSPCTHSGHTEDHICHAVWTPSPLYSWGRGKVAARVERKGFVPGHGPWVARAMFCPIHWTYWSMDTLSARHTGSCCVTHGSRDGIWSSVGEAKRLTSCIPLCCLSQMNYWHTTLTMH